MRYRHARVHAVNMLDTTHKKAPSHREWVCSHLNGTVCSRRPKNVAKKCTLHVAADARPRLRGAPWGSTRAREDLTCMELLPSGLLTTPLQPYEDRTLSPRAVVELQWEIVALVYRCDGAPPSSNACRRCAHGIVFVCFHLQGLNLPR